MQVRDDVPGHGRSGRPSGSEDYPSQRFAEDFEAVCEAFDVKKPILVRWNVRAKISTDIATYLPFDTLRGAVRLSGSSYLDPKLGTIISIAMNSIASQLLSGSNIADQQKANIAAIRLLLLRDPNPSANFF
ncbi:hypothetical protein ACEPAH_6417 [Sanghuangporus vaninii]